MLERAERVTGMERLEGRDGADDDKVGLGGGVRDGEADGDCGGGIQADEEDLLACGAQGEQIVLVLKQYERTLLRLFSLTAEIRIA